MLIFSVFLKKNTTGRKNFCEKLPSQYVFQKNQGGVIVLIKKLKKSIYGNIAFFLMEVQI
jgi:hypothetical protein